MHEINFCFLPGRSVLPKSIPKEWIHVHSPAQQGPGQGRAAGNTEKRELKSVWTKPVQDTNRQGTVFVQNFSSWDVQMRPLWFYYLDFRKNLIWLPQFPVSTTANILHSLFFCWRTKNRKWLVFFFVCFCLFHTVVMILTEAGKELDNENCRCGIPFLNPLCCCWMSGRQWRYSRRCCEAEAEQAFFLDRDPPVKLSSNSPAQTLLGCITGLVSNGQCDAKPGKDTEHFGWVTLLRNENFCGEKPQQALPSPQAVNSSVFWRWGQCSHAKISGQPWGEAVATGRLYFFLFCFHVLLKVTCRRKSSEVTTGPWSQVGAQPQGAKPVSGRFWQILCHRFLISEGRLKEGKCLVLQMVSKKPFSSFCVCDCRSKMPCSNPWMLSDNNCILTASWKTAQRQSSWGAHAFISPPVWDEGPHFRAPSCKAQSCSSHWISPSPWASSLPAGLSLPLWAACGDDG